MLQSEREIIGEKFQYILEDYIADEKWGKSY